MSKAERLRARTTGKHYAKLGSKLGGFSSFSQFVRFLRSIEMPKNEELTSEQISVAWTWVQKTIKKSRESNQLSLA